MMSEKLRLVGFFRELPHGLPSAASIHDATRPDPHMNEAAIIRYLRAGTLICLTMGPGQDVLSRSGEFTDPPHAVTDGRYIWPLDLAYYVERYHVALPAEFIARMDQVGWTPPRVAAFDFPNPAECVIL